MQYRKVMIVILPGLVFRTQLQVVKYRKSCNSHLSFSNLHIICTRHVVLIFTEAMCFVPLRTVTAETAFSSKTSHMTWNTLGSLLIFSRRVTRRFIALVSLRDSLLITLLTNRVGATLPGSTSFARVSKHFSKAAIAACALMVGWSCTNSRLREFPLSVNRRKTCQLGLIINWD